MTSVDGIEADTGQGTLKIGGLMADRALQKTARRHSDAKAALRLVSVSHVSHVKLYDAN